MRFDKTFDFIEEYPMFNVLNEVERAKLLRVVEYKVIPKFQFIYKYGDTAENVYFLMKGVVKSSVFSSDGKEIIKALYHPKAIFGELGLTGVPKRKEYIQTLKEEVHVYSIRIKDIRAIMANNFRLTTEFMNFIGQRLTSTESKLESLVFKDARARIIYFIKESIRTHGRKVGFEMLLKHPLTHQDIANLTYTSRQTVTLVLNELKKSNLINFNRGRILVRDMAGLV